MIESNKSPAGMFIVISHHFVIHVSFILHSYTFTANVGRDGTGFFGILLFSLSLKGGGVIPDYLECVGTITPPLLQKHLDILH